MLYWRKFINLSSLWNNYNSSWMLSCCFNSCTPLRYSVSFSTTYRYSSFFIIFFHITIRCLISYCTNSSRFKCSSFTKYNFCIFMCFCLIFSREVKIYIWLFISIKSQESFERYVHTIFIKSMSTFRTHFIRQIKSIFYTIISKVWIFALRTSIMWW